jgi:hypothetical protein
MPSSSSASWLADTLSLSDGRIERVEIAWWLGSPGNHPVDHRAQSAMPETPAWRSFLQVGWLVGRDAVASFAF